MKVLIADKFEETGMTALRDAKCEIAYDATLKGEALKEALVRECPDILIVRSTRVTAEMIAACQSLALIIRAGAGYNTIDVAAASARGVTVANCPGKNAVAVAELTWALILSLDRRVVENVTDLREGRWNKKEYSKARGIKGRTLGVVGVGQIGQAVIRRARSFEMPVVAYSRSLTDARAADLGVQRCASPAEVAEQCDILTIHLAATPQTHHLINADVLSRLRPGSTLINTARADVVDYQALAEAVQKRDLRVGLDVYPDEPATGLAAFSDSIVKDSGHVYGTHHIGASTDQAQGAIAAEAVRVALTFAAVGEAPNCVNIESTSKAQCRMIVRHYDRVGVLAHVLERISQAKINVEEMSNTIFQGREAAIAILRLNITPDPAVIDSIAAMKEQVICVDVKPISESEMIAAG